MTLTTAAINALTADELEELTNPDISEPLALEQAICAAYVADPCGYNLHRLCERMAREHGASCACAAQQGDTIHVWVEEWFEDFYGEDFTIPYERSYYWNGSQWTLAA